MDIFDRMFELLPLWAWALIGLAAFVGAWMAIQAYFAQKRADELAAVAQRLGFSFDPTKISYSPSDAEARAGVFSRGHGKKLRNQMTGTFAGLQIRLFDYSFTVGHGKNSRHYAQTIAAYSKSGLVMPHFQLRPNTIWRKIWNLFSRKNISFDSHPSFSSRFQVRGSQVEMIRDLFTPPLLSFMESLGPKRNWNLEGCGDRVLIYYQGSKSAPSDIQVFLEETSAVAQSFFSFARKY